MRFWSIVVDEPRTVVVPSIRSRSSEISFIGIIMVGLTMTSSNQGSFSATNPPVVPTKYAKIQRGGRAARGRNLPGYMSSSVGGSPTSTTVGGLGGFRMSCA